MPSLDELRRQLREGKIRRFANEAAEIEKAEPKRPTNERMAARIEELKEKAKAKAKEAPRGTRGRYKISAGGEDAILLFGKHRGKPLSLIMEEDPTYVAWLLRPPEKPEDGFDEPLLDVARYVQAAHWRRKRTERAKRRKR